MSKNVLIITGSPRMNGNSEMLASSFAKGAASKGHLVTKFRAATKKINGCKACNACWTKGRACAFLDGFSELEPLLEQADVLVLSTPLYWFSYSAQIKAAIDRMNAYDSERTIRPLHITESALLACGACEDRDIFDGVVSSYQLMARYQRWKNVGVLTFPGVKEKGDIANGRALAEAEIFGAKL